jgi:hypothetical protein
MSVGSAGTRHRALAASGSPVEADHDSVRDMDRYAEPGPETTASHREETKVTVGLSLGNTKHLAAVWHNH